MVATTAIAFAFVQRSVDVSMKPVSRNVAATAGDVSRSHDTERNSRLKVRKVMDRHINAIGRPYYCPEGIPGAIDVAGFFAPGINHRGTRLPRLNDRFCAGTIGRGVARLLVFNAVFFVD
jgi:hypothetical protein